MGYVVLLVIAKYNICQGVVVKLLHHDQLYKSIAKYDILLGVVCVV